MQLRAFFHRHSKSATPVAVHIFMLLGVTLYTIIGAMIMQKIESNAPQNNRNEELIHSPKRMQRHNFKYRRNIRENDCLANIVKYVHGRTCNSSYILKVLKSCYNASAEVASSQRYGWSFSDSVLFCFTVITTIGYGNVSPKTFTGQLFCILYALLGIPFTLLAIADLGKFISEIMETSSETCFKISKKITRLVRQIRRRPKFSIINTYVDTNNNQDNNQDIIINMNNNKIVQSTDQSSINAYHKISNEVERKLSPFENHDLKLKENVANENSTANEESSEKDDKPNFKHSQAVTLLMFFLIYVLLGAFIMPFYEPDMVFFKAIYFNFVSLTSIGLGDIVPQSESYMALTLLYIAVGLAITTIAIEIAADYLKKLHYFGRKIENVGNVVIWFGGKKLTMKQLVKNLGDQFNLPVHAVKTLDLDKFVDDAIKVEEGELETLRPPPIEPKDLLEDGTLNFADDDGTEGNLHWIRQRSPSTSPELERNPTFQQNSEHDHEFDQEHEEHATETKEESLDDSKDSESSEKEMESEISEEIIDISPLYYEEPKEDMIATNCDKESSPSEAGERRKSNYSEEAWRRYLEYQKQWRKYRQTKTIATGLNIPTDMQYTKGRGATEGTSKMIGASKIDQEVRVPNMKSLSPRGSASKPTKQIQKSKY
uniref:Potassium channel domain-containing protein n=1 Tax=Meloidogyne enterolobii TaxID=390850 RepID=A0A6V7UUM9_MELEN|nr:unnamed protein product [Meloidogyne enterolobii]